MTVVPNKVLSASESTMARGLTDSQQREAALASARRYLRLLAVEDVQNLSADTLRDRLARCRAFLEAVVEASISREPLARTVDDAAAALGVSPLTVYRLVASGDLLAYRISRRRIRIDETALRSYLVGHTVGSGGITDSDIAEQHVRPAWQ